MEPNQLYKLVTDLREIMEKDGKITSEETNIIASVTKSVEQFTSAYNKALEDSIITQEETTNLAILWDKIYDDSYSTAMQDSHLSDDEATMIFKIFDALKQYN